MTDVISARNANYDIQNKKRQIVLKAKDRPCADCGKKYPPCVMDFDHRDKATKLFCIGAGHQVAGYRKLIEEIAKCDVVCANCHRLRTWRHSQSSVSS